MGAWEELGEIISRGGEGGREGGRKGETVELTEGRVGLWEGRGGREVLVGR